MSAAVYTPCQSPSRTDIFVCGSPTRLPPRQPASATPDITKQQLTLTPSPLHQGIDFEHECTTAMQLDFDAFSGATNFSTPFHSSALAISSPRGRRKDLDMPHSFHRPPRLPLDDDDDDEGLFLRSNVGHTSLPLQTPDRVSNSICVNRLSNASFSYAPKRKGNHFTSPPNSKLGLTPLRIRQSTDESGNERFATLAPLPAPRFLRNRASIGNAVGRQVDTLKQMHLTEQAMDFETDSSSEEELLIDSLRRPARLVRTSDSDFQDAGQAALNERIGGGRSKSRPSSWELTTSASSISSDSPLHSRHRRTTSDTSVSEETRSPNKKCKVERPQTTLNRLASSATLFFGPAIHSSNLGSEAAKHIEGSSSHNSPLSTSPRAYCGNNDDDFFSPKSYSINASCGIGDATITGEGPSSREVIPTKFKKLNDSTVILSNDDENALRDTTVLQVAKAGATTVHQSSSTYPSTSYSTSSEFTLFDESYITPSNELSKDPAWPDSALDETFVDEFIAKTLAAGTKGTGGNSKRMPNTPQKRNRMSVIGVPEPRPWTTVVADKIIHTPLFDELLPGLNFGGVQDSSASTQSPSLPRRRSNVNKPRKSCPGNIEPTTQQSIEQENLNTHFSSAESTVSELELSPTRTQLAIPKSRTYGNVGMGRPGSTIRGAQFLLRRSSSGAISTASDISDSSQFGTPTRKGGNDLRIPMLPLKSQLSAVDYHQDVASKPSVTMKQSFTTRGRSSFHTSSKAFKENMRPDIHTSPAIPVNQMAKVSFMRRISNSTAAARKRRSWHSGCLPASDLLGISEQPGRFEHDFVEVDTIGSGEFGSVIKVRYGGVQDQEDREYAIKKSKGFEGIRHRSRLLEEVEILQHLSRRAGTQFHSNVLGYIDSWEEDNRLFILTELCEFGNFAHFLDEYGRNFARLDEARVWKIFADISSGLQFIHAADVVHFDLKPANIFITSSGRFKIGDFGMASKWPRSWTEEDGLPGQSRQGNGFEREGDKMYLAAEVLQGKYGKETDIFSFGMMMLEASTNIVVPTQGDLWHRLREEDFGPIEGLEDCSEALTRLISSMMLKDPARRPKAEDIYSHINVTRARERMEQALEALKVDGETRPEVLFQTSPLAGADANFLSDILGL